MPLTPPGIIAPVVSNLVATAHLGVGVPKFAAGVSNGLLLWVSKVKATTVDTGQLGVGRGATAVATPPPAWVAALTAGFTAHGLLGVFAPLTIVGLGNGLSTAFLQAQVVTQHPMIGTGTGVVKFAAPPATADMIQGFKTAGMDGEGSRKIAMAIGMALPTVFSALVLPTVIAGAASSVSGGGTGFGQIT